MELTCRVHATVGRGGHYVQRLRASVDRMRNVPSLTEIGDVVGATSEASTDG